MKIQHAIICILLIAIGYIQHTNFESVYQLMTMNSRTQYDIMDTEGRILHYVSKHDHEFIGCPECQLLKQFHIRQHEINETLSGPMTEEARKNLLVERNRLEKYMLRQP